MERDTCRYRDTEAAHEESRKAVTGSVLAALRAGLPPTAVAAASPYSEIYVRKLARENGIPDYPLRRFPRARGELDALLPPGTRRRKRSQPSASAWTTPNTSAASCGPA